jgi:hypothetical protein
MSEIPRSDVDLKQQAARSNDKVIALPGRCDDLEYESDPEDTDR